MVLSALQIINLFAVFLLLLLAIVFVLYPTGRKTSNYILSAFLFSNFILLAHFFAFITIRNFTREFSILNHIGGYSYLLLAPFLFLYIVSLCNKEFRFSFKSVLHLLPYLIFTASSFVIDALTGSIGRNISLVWEYYYKVYINVLDIQIAIYIILSFRELRIYRLAIKDNFSNIAKINLKWVNLVLYFLIFMWLTDLSNRILGMIHFRNGKVFYYLLVQSVSTDLVLCICLIYKGMQQTSAPSGVSPQPKYSHTKLEANVYEENKILLTQIMSIEKPFLLPELNLDDLAKMMNKPSKQISQTINLCFSLNFNKYINQYRVNEAKRIMEKDVGDKKTVYEILLDAGFNSKSVFNEAFKRHAGITPKEYRRIIKTQLAQ